MRAGRTPGRGFFMAAGSVLLLLWLAGPARASDPGTVGADFLRIPVAPIPTGLGTAVTSVEGPDSLFYNPAGLALLKRPVLSAAHNEYFEGLRQEYLALAIPIQGAGVLGFGGSYLYSGAIQSYDASDNPIGSYSTSGGVAVASYAQRWPLTERPRPRRPWEKRRPPPKEAPWRVAFGASVKLISERLDDKAGQTPAFDAGLLLRLPQDVQLGASVLNVGGSHTVDQTGFPLPRELRAGLSRLFQLQDTMSMRVMADVMQDRTQDLAFLSGVEFCPLPWLAVRGGYRTNLDAGSGLSFGMGLGGDFLGQGGGLLRGLRLDYAYADGGPFGATHRIGIQMRW